MNTNRNEQYSIIRLQLFEQDKLEFSNIICRQICNQFNLLTIRVCIISLENL